MTKFFRLGATSAALVAALLISSCAPLPAPTAAPSSPSSTPTALPTSTPTPTPTPLPTPTPAPTLDPNAVVAEISAGEARLQAEGIEPLCLRWEDSDGDGEPEWIGLYLQPGEPPKLRAFVLNGDAWYDLLPPDGEEYGMGEYPDCELDVRDVNNDGRVEILVWGHAGTSVGILHIFVWEGTSYALLAFFQGDAGVHMADTDGDLLDEIAVAYDAGDDLVWEAVHTWDGANYAWTWERYAWFYRDRPHAYHSDTPEHAVISFYLALDDRDLPGAYGLLGPAAQAASSLDEWAAGFATTIAAEVGSVHELTRSGDTASVIAQVRGYDNLDGRVVATLWDVTWQTVQTSAGWRLESGATDELEQHEAVYYP